jgi:endonuclease/exonuclease/phosphatase family metal-dependent hydrolase
MHGGCLGCFLEHLADEKFEACLGQEPSDPALFGGAFDIGLLSRYPILQSAALEYDAYFARGSAWYAQVDVPGLGPVDTFCTHFSSSLGAIPYRGPHGSWSGEHAYQTAQLLGFMARKGDSHRPLLVLGDLNAGPGTDVLRAIEPQDYHLLLASGLEEAVASPFCTMCPDNVFRGPESDGIFIDHALLKGFGGTSSGESVLVQTFSLAGTALNMSDHYGLRVTLSSE